MVSMLIVLVNIISSSSYRLLIVFLSSDLGHTRLDAFIHHSKLAMFPLPVKLCLCEGFAIRISDEGEPTDRN